MNPLCGRTWAMPNKETFEINPIKDLILNESRCVQELQKTSSIDPFARRNHGLADITNDINPEADTSYNLDALEFLKHFEDRSVGLVLNDPPYSLRQVKECYDGIGKALTQHETQHFFSDVRNEIARVLEVGGICISFGWSSVGIGKSRGFEITKVLLVCHGGIHNDTICTVEQKVRHIHG